MIARIQVSTASGSLVLRSAPAPSSPSALRLIAESPIRCRIGCIRLFLLLDNFLIDFIAHSRTPQNKTARGGSTQRRQRGNAVGVPAVLRAALFHLDWIFTNPSNALHLGNPATNRGCLDRIKDSLSFINLSRSAWIPRCALIASHTGLGSVRGNVHCSNALASIRACLPAL